ncbi:MAG: tetratricopeptide repeat protein, partial [Bacteroidia bacterium]
MNCKFLLINVVFLMVLVFTNSRDAFGENKGKDYVNSLIKKGSDQCYVDQDSAMFYADKALFEAKALQFKSGTGRSFQLKSIVFYLKGNLDSAIVNIDRATNIFQNINDTSSLVGALSLKSTIFWAQGRLKEAKISYLETYNQYQLLNDSNGIAVVLNNLGQLALSEENFIEAQTYFQKGISIAKASKNEVVLADLYNNISEIFSLDANYALTLKYLKLSNRLSQKLGNNINYYWTEINIAKLYIKAGLYTNAIELCEKNLPKVAELAKDQLLSSIFADLGAANYYLGNYSESVALFDSAIVRYQNKAESTEIIKCAILKSNCFIELNDLQKAISVFEFVDTLNFENKLDKARYLKHKANLIIENKNASFKELEKANYYLNISFRLMKSASYDESIQVYR